MSSLKSLSWLVAAALIAGGCSTFVVVAPKMPAPDSITKSGLATYIRTTPNPTIVLRVPTARGQLAQSDQTFDQIYNLIEKELVKADFAVRDRGLLNEIVRSGQNLDYRMILQRTQAQLILEIVSIESKDFNNTEFQRVKDHVKGTLEKGAFPIQGWRFQCKVTLVSTGEIGGIYTIDIAPEQNHFLVHGDEIQNASASGYPEGPTLKGNATAPSIGYTMTLADAAQPFVTQLMAQLKGR